MVPIALILVAMLIIKEFTIMISITISGKCPCWMTFSGLNIWLRLLMETSQMDTHLKVGKSMLFSILDLPTFLFLMTIICQLSTKLLKHLACLKFLLKMVLLSLLAMLNGLPFISNSRATGIKLTLRIILSTSVRTVTNLCVTSLLSATNSTSSCSVFLPSVVS